MFCVYSQCRISTLSDPWERLICAVIMQAVSDFRHPGYREEVIEFFSGPFIEELGIDGKLLARMARKVIGGKA